MRYVEGGNTEKIAEMIADVTEEELVLEKKDMVLLIEVEDELHNMDQALEQLAGHGHASGEFIKLDNVFDVIQNNSHVCFSSVSEEYLY